MGHQWQTEEIILPQYSLENYIVYWSFSQSHGWGVIYRNMGDSKAFTSLKSLWWYYWIKAYFLSFLPNLQASTLKSFLAQKLLLCTNPVEGPCESCNFINFLSLVSLIGSPSLMNLIFFLPEEIVYFTESSCRRKNSSVLRSVKSWFCFLLVGTEWVKDKNTYLKRLLLYECTQSLWVF